MQHLLRQSRRTGGHTVRTPLLLEVFVHLDEHQPQQHYLSGVQGRHQPEHDRAHLHQGREQISRYSKRDGTFDTSSSQINQVQSVSLILPRVDNEDFIGDGISNDDLIKHKFFNIHNGVSLAGFGFSPPLFFQAFTTRTNVEIDPVNGTPLNRDNNREMLHSMMKLMIGILLLLVFFM